MKCLLKGKGEDMRIEKIAIENFRLLESTEMTFERTTTLIVGRNNSGYSAQLKS